MTAQVAISKFIIEFTFIDQQELKIKIYNLMGNSIYKIPQQKTSNELFKVDFSNQPNGIYYVKVITKEGILTRKIVLMR